MWKHAVLSTGWVIAGGCTTGAPSVVHQVVEDASLVDSDGTLVAPIIQGDTGAGTDEAGSGPPYPLVLAHGFGGFDDFAGVEFIDYFYGVANHLEDAGQGPVTTPALDPFDDSQVRGEALLAHVESVLAETGAAKVNIVGHSQGRIVL